MKDFRNYLLALLIVAIAVLGWTTYKQITFNDRQSKIINGLKKDIETNKKKLTEAVMTGTTLYNKNKKLAKSYISLSKKYKKNNEEINRLNVALEEARSQPLTYIPVDNSKEIQNGLNNIASSIDLQTLINAQAEAEGRAQNEWNNTEEWHDSVGLPR